MRRCNVCLDFSNNMGVEGTVKTINECIELLEQSQAEDQMVSIFEDDIADILQYLKEYRYLAISLNPKRRECE